MKPDHPAPLNCFRALRLVLVTLPFLLQSAAFAVDAAKVKFDVPAGDAAQTLKQFAAQAKREILFPVQPVGAVKTAAVQGELTVKEGLDQLLAGTELTALEDAKTGAIVVKRDAGPNAPGRPQKDEAPAKVAEGKLVLDKFEVMGSRLLNMDKPRSRDDAQPYVIFDRTIIERSGATNLEDLLRQRLPMETTVTSESQQPNTAYGSRSTINLRGLGPGQTLILVDGHRVAGSTTIDSLLQPDLNGIPLAAIERIEILPTTASGIYGGGATGGVVNIILRRDYAGAEAKFSYTNSFDTDSAIRRVDVSAGFTLEGGKTNVLLAASYSDGNSLLEQDRGFLKRNRLTIDANDPTYKFRSIPYTGATSNVRSTNGQNLTLKPQYGGGAVNSTITYVPYGYAGPASDNGAGLIANAGHHNFDLSNGQDAGSNLTSLINTPTIESFSASVRRQFSDRFQAFVDFGLNKNTGHKRGWSSSSPTFNVQASAAGNPFNQPIIVSFPQYIDPVEAVSTSEDRRGVAGVIVKVPGEWQIGADYTYNQSSLSSQNSSSTLTYPPAINSGAIDVFRDLVAYPIDAARYRTPVSVLATPLKVTLRDAVVRASGPVWTLPGGRPTAAVLLEDREEKTGAGFWSIGNRILPAREQSVRSAYIELKIPLVGPDNALPFVRALDLQLAGRRDEYDTLGANTPTTVAAIKYVTNKLSSTDPTIALRWVPTPDLMVRASYGTGFLPPNITQLSANDPFLGILGFLGLSDPKRGGTSPSGGAYYFGGDPNLTPEKSKTYSTGLVLTPRAIPGLRLSVDWLRIEKTDNIVNNPNAQLILNNEDRFQVRVVRGPKLPGDPASWSGPITELYVTAVNIARANLEAYDIQLDYRWDSQSLGTFDFFAVATKATHYETQTFPGEAIVENVGTSNNASLINIGSGSNYPLKLKGNIGVNWNRGAWSAGWTLRYFDSYLLSKELLASSIPLQGNGGRVDSQVFHDVYVGYRFGSSGSKLLRRTELQIGVKNVLNTYPTFDASAYSYNGYNDPRLASYTITLKKGF
ncbi:MAG: TonB-dependent receptor [Lacunisphaera sp.]|nr:TonB-dependent receptor [Lacunisphaera sp.]